MEKKNSVEYYSQRAASWSKRQLVYVDTAIEKIKSSNWFVRHFNKESLEVLEKQKAYINTMIKKEEQFVAYKRMQGEQTPQEIVKANRALEKQLKAGEGIKYTSKREENQIANKPKSKRGRPKGKPRGKKNVFLKKEEVMNDKPRRLFYE